MSSFFGINIALKGMMAQQVALDVAAHNIANANTEGYSRQRVNMETSTPISGLVPGVGQMGSGVDVAEVTRVKDQFLDYQVRKETSTKEAELAISNTLEQVQTVFMEPSETGFNEQMDNFWNNWQELSKSPESSPVRTTLKEAAVSLTDTLRQMSTQLTEIKDDAQNQIQLRIDEVNSLADRIARLNDQIVKVKIAGQNPNDLLDKRDQALDQLAAIGNISINDCLDINGKATGAIEVKLGDRTILDAGGALAINNADLESANVKDGALAGLLKVGGDEDLSNTVQHYIDKLDTLAVGIAKAINDIHVNGMTLDGSAGQNFFVFKDGAGNEIDLNTVDWSNPALSGLSSANIYINPTIEKDVSQIAASKQDGIFLEGNGEMALQIADLKSATLKYDPVNRVLLNQSGDVTLGMFYQDMITELGSATSESQKKVINQQALVDQTTSRRESTQGVSLDEETANMVLYQHAFEANAKVISVMDEMLNTIINDLKR